jgi:hypothetical protein
MSRFAESNGGVKRCLDGLGNPVQGEIIAGDGTGTILRFVNGLLDGDAITGGGIISLPAVEAPGHLEWWRQGKLHRDNGLPAVISDNLSVYEWWVDGKQI